MTEFSYESSRFVVLIGPATDEILEVHFVRLMVFAGVAWACHRHTFGVPVCFLPVYAGVAAAMDGMSCSFLSSQVLNE